MYVLKNLTFFLYLQQFHLLMTLIVNWLMPFQMKIIYDLCFLHNLKKKL